MPKTKSRIYPKTKRQLKLVHFQAIVVFILYNVVSKANFVHALIKDSFLFAFLKVYSFGVIATFAFLYLFSHEDFFQFAKEVEKKEIIKEKKYLTNLYHYGRVLTVIVIGSIGGPVFLALTLRLLFHRHDIKYPLVFLAIFISTLIGFGLIKKSILLL